ncbi:MAG: hypothetical protein GY790_02975 [Bacteroidetes bacterium]|nr:hypothetical protein [Bacteroidota bacterium]
MKEEAYEIIGKKITGIVIKQASNPGMSPRSQLHLTFEDGSAYEFYCDRDVIRPTAGVIPNRGVDQALEYMGPDFLNIYSARINEESGEVEWEVMPGADLLV